VEGPRVPQLERPRAALWSGVAGLSLYLALGPGALDRLEPRRDASGGCVLTAREGEAPCACEELPGALRRALGLPLPLARASAEDLERLPGIGPRRARAIVEERERRPFASLEDLRRVRGIGAATLRALSAQLFLGSPDPACRSGLTRSGALRPD